MKIMRSKASKILVALVASITLLLCLPLTAAAQGPEILLDPTPVNVLSGDPFTVALRINNIPPPGMALYDFRITYNPSVINFDVNEGDHSWPHPAYGTPLFLNVDNTAGSISFNDTYTTVPHPNGSLTLVVLHGTAISALPSSTTLHFDKVDIMNPSATLVPAEVTDGEVIVTPSAPPPIPTMSQWGAIGMTILFGALLVWFVRRRWVANASRS